MTFSIPASPPSTYLTLALRQLKFSTIQTNLLVIPSQIGSILSMMGLALLSEQVNERTGVSMLEQIWILPFLIALRALPKNPDPWTFYGLSTLLLSFPYSHPVQVAWTSRNAGAVATRTVSASVYNMYVARASFPAVVPSNPSDQGLYKPLSSFHHRYIAQMMHPDVSPFLTPLYRAFC